jgi:hypothetical protein
VFLCRAEVNEKKLQDPGLAVPGKLCEERGVLEDIPFTRNQGTELG